MLPVFLRKQVLLDTVAGTYSRENNKRQIKDIIAIGHFFSPFSNWL